MSDEVIDPAVALKEKCASTECKALQAGLEECTKRVNSHPGSTENCQEELYDFLRCVDKCVAPQLFAKLK